MNIFFLTVNYSLRTSGGIGTYIHTLANGLVLAGHDVTVLSPVIVEREHASYNVCKVPNDVNTSKRRTELSKIFSQKLFRIGRESTIDIVEATDWGMEGFDCLCSDRFATVIRFHTPNSVVDNLNGYSRLKDSEHVNKMECEYFSNAQYLSFPSKAMARFVVNNWDLNTDNVKVINNPVDFKIGKIDDSNQKYSSTIRLGFLGRLEPRKGVYILAESLQYLFSKLENLEACFIGPDTRLSSGSVGKHLRNTLDQWSGKVVFTGHLSGREKFDAIESCDLFVLPSLWENFPYACLEVMAAGKYVIASSDSGFEELIDSGKNGMLVPPGNPEALSQAIIDVINNETYKVEINRGKYIDRFNTKHIVTEMVKYYQWVIQRKNRKSAL
jgi:glycogen synthase